MQSPRCTTATSWPDASTSSVDTPARYDRLIIEWDSGTRYRVIPQTRNGAQLIWDLGTNGVGSPCNVILASRQRNMHFDDFDQRLLLTEKRDCQTYFSAGRATVTGTPTTRTAAGDSARAVPRTFATAGENAR